MRAPTGYDTAGRLVWGHERAEPPEWADYARESHDALLYAPWPETADPSEVLNTYTPPPTERTDDDRA